MTLRTPNSIKQPKSFSDSKQENQHGDELDLNLLLKALWDGKFVVIGFALIFTAAAAVISFSTPNIYRSSASIMMSIDPYGFAEEQGNSVGEIAIYDSKVFFESLKSAHFNSQILKSSGKEPSALNGVALNFNRKTGVIVVSKEAQEAEVAWESVKTFTDNINVAAKQIELEKLLVAIQSMEKLILTPIASASSSHVLSEKYAKLLFKQALLLSSQFELVKVLVEPQPPSNPIRPKHKLIMMLGLLLGVVNGTAFVLFRLAFNRH